MFPGLFQGEKTRLTQTYINTQAHIDTFSTHTYIHKSTPVSTDTHTYTCRRGWIESVDDGSSSGYYRSSGRGFIRL